MPDLWTVVGKLSHNLIDVYSSGGWLLGDIVADIETWVSATFRDEDEALGYLTEIEALADKCVELRNDLIEAYDTNDQIDLKTQVFDGAVARLKRFDKSVPEIPNPKDNGDEFFYRFSIHKNPLKGF